MLVRFGSARNPLSCYRLQPVSATVSPSLSKGKPSVDLPIPTQACLRHLWVMQQSEAEQALHRIERELDSQSPVKVPSNGGATAGRVEKTSMDAHLDAVIFWLQGCW